MPLPLVPLLSNLLPSLLARQQMIDFCAEHDILSDIELVPATPEARTACPSLVNHSTGPLLRAAPDGAFA